MNLQRLNKDFSICKLGAPVNKLAGDFVFYAKTDGEVSLVCEAEHEPRGAVSVQRGYRALRVEGTLDFELVGILAGLSGVLAEAGISVFAVSTYDTDYLFIKNRDFDRAASLLLENGFTVT